ncbi:hypothetical protein AL036_09765 [Salipiger aestuarii]|uniref:hypothetical protein n=1 Tax=Salipiger aestuarii TaxID=568098 RepID=UPI00025B8441|nr:hypothetical protein [Salipiger aestuarii]EIE50620.1 hypothetical protein C357_12876 [Citreicella sp. 357]KAA8607753.1 hypothetical protein AL036_09765 [Salipiger aestuarii]
MTRDGHTQTRGEQTLARGLKVLRLVRCGIVGGGIVGGGIVAAPAAPCRPDDRIARLARADATEISQPPWPEARR